MTPEQVERDARDGTQGPWAVERPSHHYGMREISGPALTCRGFTSATNVDAMKAARIEADARRIACVPELEAYYLTHATQDAAKDARIRELEKALLPFSEMAGELFAKNWNNDEIAMSVNRDGKCSKLLASAFFDARAVLQGEK